MTKKEKVTKAQLFGKIQNLKKKVILPNIYSQFFFNWENNETEGGLIKRKSWKNAKLLDLDLKRSK